MHKVLKKLYLDHAHFTQLMDIFEGELDKYNTGGKLTVGLISDLIDYVDDYMDNIHHPIEDLLYQTQLARSDKGRDVLEKLLVQHQVIMTLTKEFKLAFAGNAQGSGISPDEVNQKGRDYIEQQRGHLKFEEKDAFPLLREELSDEDFDLAAGALPAEEDPLMDSSLKERYPILAEHLAQ
jgi:hemerythrin-like domain-containing protein